MIDKTDNIDITEVREETHWHQLHVWQCDIKLNTDSTQIIAILSEYR